MDFNKLNTFCMVAELESVTAAASRLFRTQSAISQQLALLEDELGMALLDRKGSKIFLTKEGERLYHFAKPRLLEISDEAVRLKNDSRSLSGVLRLAALDEVYEYFLPELIMAFNDEYPNIEVIVSPNSHESVDQDMLNNRADLGFMILYDDPDLYQNHPYFCFKRICVGAPEYLKKYKPISKLADLADMHLIDSGAHIPSIKFWVKKNDPSASKLFKDKTAFISVRGAEAQKKFYLSGKGVGMMHEFMVQDELKSGELQHILPKKTKPIYVTVDLARKRKFTTQLVHEKFVEFALKYSKERGLNQF